MRFVCYNSLSQRCSCKDIRQILRLDVAVHQQSSFLDNGTWRRLAQSNLREGVLESNTELLLFMPHTDLAERLLCLQGGARMASMALFLKWTVALLLLVTATTSAHTDADFQMRAQMRALKQFGESCPDPTCLGQIVKPRPLTTPDGLPKAAYSWHS